MQAGSLHTHFVSSLPCTKARGSVSRRQHRGSEKPEGLGFGLISDSDTMWTEEREGQKHQVTRAVRFLMDVFDLVEEKVVVVVTHSGEMRNAHSHNHEVPHSCLQVAIYLSPSLT
jgi:hypothetical protein